MVSPKLAQEYWNRLLHMRQKIPSIEPLMLSAQQIDHFEDLSHALVKSAKVPPPLPPQPESKKVKWHSEQSNHVMIPLIVKDCILTSKLERSPFSTLAGMDRVDFPVRETWCGSEVLQEWWKRKAKSQSIQMDDRNALIVDKLLLQPWQMNENNRAEMQVVAKSIVPEMCMDIQSFSSVYNEGRPTANPYHEALSSGGSSGGSAAAVALGYAPLALGSDLGGSLRIPAGFCGVYSLRPSPRQVFLSGTIPPAFNRDMEQRYQCDLAVLGAIGTSIDWLDLFFRRATDVEVYDTKQRDKPLRVAITTNFESIETDDRIVKAITRFYERLCNGIECKVVEVPFELDKLRSAYNTLTLPMAYAVNDIETGTTSKPPATDNAHRVAKDIQAQQQEIMDQFLQEYDAWICPVTPCLPFLHNQKHLPINILRNDQAKTISYWKAIAYVTPVTTILNPVVTLPIDMVETEVTGGDFVRVPVAVQVVGRRHDELALLEHARILDKYSHAECPSPLPRLSSSKQGIDSKL